MNNFINSFLWVPVVALQYFFIAYLSLKASREQSNLVLFYVWGLGVLPTWTLIVKFTENVAMAGFVYDFTLAVGWTLGVIIFQGKEFTIYQYLGVLFMGTGILLFKR